MVKKYAVLLGLVTVFNMPNMTLAQDAGDAVRPFWGVGGSSSARASGMGGAFTGIADDQTALYHNPAGLGNLVAGEFNLGFNHMNFDTELTGGTVGTGNNLSVTRLANLGIALPVFGTKFSWGAGYNLVRAFERSKDLTFTYDDGLSEIAKITEEGRISNYSFGIGYQVSTKLAIGGAIEIQSGSNDYVYTASFAGLDSIDYFSIKPKYRTGNLSFGVLFTPVSFWRIGLLLRTPQKVSVDEEYQDPSGYDWENVDYTVKGSYNLAAGTSIFMGPMLVAADLYWIDYSQIRFSSDLYDGDIPIDLEINNEFKSSYAGVTGYAVGMEYLLPFTSAKIRSGYRHDPPFRSDNGSDGANTFSLGLSVLPVPHLKLDLVYSQTNWSVDSNENWLVGKISANLLIRL